MNGDLLPDPGLRLPPPLTLRLYAGTEVVFASDKHWLHPLFELETYFKETGVEPAGTLLVDRVTGRASAMLMAAPLAQRRGAAGRSG